MHKYNGIFELSKARISSRSCFSGVRFCSAQIEILTVKSKETEFLNSVPSHIILAVVADMKPLFLHREHL